MNTIDRTGTRALTRLDWTVVAIARNDGPRSLRPDGRLARSLKSFLGLSFARGLANERAEALRRFCVRAWHWDLIRAGDVRPLTDAGYSIADLSQILAHIAGRRRFMPSFEEAAI